MSIFLVSLQLVPRTCGFVHRVVPPWKNRRAPPPSDLRSLRPSFRSQFLLFVTMPTSPTLSLSPLSLVRASLLMLCCSLFACCLGLADARLGLCTRMHARALYSVHTAQISLE